MAASITGFRSAFPEMTGTDDAKVTAALDRALYFHDLTDHGTLLAAAHLITLDTLRSTDPKPDGGLGVVSRERIGQQEVQYSTTAGSDENKAWWATTPYGRELLQLESRNPGNVLAAVFG